MKSKLRWGIIGLLTVVAFGSAGYLQQRQAHAAQSTGDAQIIKDARISKAVAVIHPTQGNTVHGVVTFMQMGDGVHVVVNLSGLPAGEHGFHIHEFGDCSAPDGTSAGGHFNPENKPHSGPDAMERHAGDLGNITADASGNATLDRMDMHMTLNGPNMIVGRGLIIHEKADDMKTQPTGAAGARLGCGVIGVGK